MEVKTRSLEITIISAEDLRFLPGRMIKKISTFVTVRSDPNNSQRTKSDHDGGTCPYWDEKLRLALPPTARSITVEVYCKFGVGSGPTPVGSAEIPISDIVEGFVPAYQLHFLSYRLKRNRERNGIINLSARMVGPDCIGRPMQQQKGEEVPLYGNSGTAIGIPVGRYAVTTSSCS
ncbi:BON1-associated protein 2 [Cinnamomum micranthum f. kanehirae]|uniref:BON1-associated protein 2 n=1 Tax=Cinnamomum micranthum f. kanehirae TaxID=337451 RepID=A0A3S3NVW1_9MAGN|nr:BON1-associated protein 2 [Cinnamomum micranthum f. kanehirae]